MKRSSVSDMVLKVLGLLLLTAAVLKGHELLTVPVANKDLWSWRPFLIFQVEFELALGIWLLSGVFKRLAWLAALACFSLFSCVTLYKGLSGAASCGCFGRVHINPWITLIAIDLPAVVALSLFRPPQGLPPLLSFLRKRESIYHVAREFLRSMPSRPWFVATGVLSLSILGLTTPILALNKPALIAATYEVLEPKTWIGKELPIVKYIDIGDQLRTGTWLVLFYHHDCPDCQTAIPQYHQMARDMEGSEDILRIAFVEVPPYGAGPAKPQVSWVVGRLADVKEWFVTTPATILLSEGKVRSVWETMTPELTTILAEGPAVGSRT
jgi:hypothetical protein